MKKLLVTLLLILFQLSCALNMTAQTIMDGSKWWDGMNLYTAQVDAAGDVRMVGESDDSGSFKLKKSVQGYTLATDSPTGKISIRGQIGWRVEYVTSESATFLAVRKTNGDCVHAFTLTSDDLTTCVSQQKEAEGNDVSWMMQHRLLSPAYLGRFTKAELRMMRNEILARHGWVFQSKDLKDHFSSQPWYQPLGNNYSVKISLVEKTNIELIKHEETLGEKDRVHADAPVTISTTPVETPKQEVVEEVPKQEVVEEAPKQEVVEEAPKQEVVEEAPKQEMVEEAPKQEVVEEAPKQEVVEEAPKQVEVSSTIANGSRWWDGQRLFTAQVDAAGDVLMVGESANGVGDSFKLKKSKLSQTQYTLAADNPAAWVFTRGKAGWRVDYISLENTTFLAVRKTANDCVYTLTQTSDNLNECVSRQKSIEEREAGWLMQNHLLSAAYLGRFTKPQLRLMRNEILARRGWVFQSKDLKDHFGSQSWYQPKGNNSSIKMSVIEQTNIELIINEETLNEKDRVHTESPVAVPTPPVQEKVEEAPKQEVVEEAPVQEEVVEVPEQEEVEAVPEQEEVEEVPEQEEVEEVPEQKEVEAVPEQEEVEEVPEQEEVEEIPEQEVIAEVPEQEEVEEVPKQEVVQEVPKQVEKVLQKVEATINPIVTADEVVFVATEAQFLNALGNNRVVEIGTNVHLNLSTILYQRDLFADVSGRVWASTAQRGGNTPLVICEPCGDGHQLTLQNFKNLIIRGQNNSSIEVDPRYAFCLNLIDCEDCRVENLTIGHTEGGTCEGGVLGITGGRGNTIVSCDLYGCGTYGIVARETKHLSVFRTNIHDCTYGIMELWDSEDITFEDCDFFKNREFDLISNMDSQNTVFKGCRFYDNWSDVALFVSNLDITLYHCEIYHPIVGSTKRLIEPNRDCKWSKEEHFVPNPRKNPIGPDANLIK